MQTLPVFLDVRGRHCLLVGGGEAAERKRRLLQQAGALINSVGDTFDEQSLSDVVLAIAASENLVLNERVSLAAQARRIPVNVVDQPQLCTFIFPAVVERGQITVAVSSAGTMPVFTRLLRARIETLLPPSLGDFVARAADFRLQVRQQVPDMRRRLRFWDGLLQRQLIGAGSDLQVTGSTDAFDRELKAFLAGEQLGRISVVGAGTGDPDLLTFKALRCLQACDLLVFDGEVSPDIAQLARRDARRHLLQAGEDVAALLQAEARQGAHIAWLLAGDPLSYRKVPQLLMQWQAAGIACDIVPGIIDQAKNFAEGT